MSGIFFGGIPGPILACALSAGTSIVVSGDRDLLEVDGYDGIGVLNPREFTERHLDIIG